MTDAAPTDGRDSVRPAGPRYKRDAGEFGKGPGFALGVEEELLLVGADNELLDRGRQAIQRTDEPEEGALTDELFKAMVESQSDVSRNANEAVDGLRALRCQLIESGSRLMGSGLHPNAAVGEGAVERGPRYALIADSLQGVLRTPICGQHIHVGMPDEQTAVRAYNGIRTHVPLLNALAANSPFWFGEDSGLASSRTVIFRSYPRAAMAPEVVDYAHYCKVVEEVCVAAGVDDYTHIWWDVRIHPKLGTIEIRAADTQFDVRRTAALAALVHCLVRVEADRDQTGIPSREALAESTFQATRHGLDATLLDREGDPTPASDLGAQTLALAASVADEFRCHHELEHIEAMLEAGCAARLQRRAYETGGMGELLAFLVRETAEEHQWPA
jgi:glutamate---cysteine ligase / carboxylate-amine ligase